MGWNTRGKRKGLSGKKSGFNPGHSYVHKAVENFLKKGGNITILEPSFEETVVVNDRSSVDYFLLGK